MCKGQTKIVAVEDCGNYGGEPEVCNDEKQTKN